MKLYNSINIIKVIISICVILSLFSCSSRKILLDFPPYMDELPQIQTGYYSVYETDNGIPSDTIGNEFLGEFRHISIKLIFWKMENILVELKVRSCLIII